jgi:hypothetical protein
MLFATENSIQLARFRAVALAEDTLLCKAKQQRSRWYSANPEVNVTDCFGAEAYCFRRTSGGLEIVRARSARLVRGPGRKARLNAAR